MSKVVRSVKNVTKGYSSVQVKVRNATSNDPWGPTGTEMSEISQMTFNGSNDFYEIMDMLDKRMNDKGKNWRHVLKSLKVLDYCLHEGSELVVTWARKNVYIIKTLREFQYIDDDGRDVGQNVRTSARDLTSLILDEERLRMERSDRRNWKSRVTGLDDSSGYNDGNTRNRPRAQRPQAPDEEDAEYRLAIEASKYEAEEEERKRRGAASPAQDDDLAKAIRLSKEEEELRRRELEDNNATTLFDDAPAQHQPQFTGYNQGYQQQGQVDFFGNPINVQTAQDTGYLNNAYAQHTGMPNGYDQSQLLQQQQFQQQQQQILQQQHTIQPQSTAFDTLNNPYAQQHVSAQPQSPQLQPGSHNPWATNAAPQASLQAPTSLKPMLTGSNNPFASNKPKTTSNFLQPLPEQKTASFNPIANYAIPSEPAPSSPPQPQQQQQKPILLQSQHDRLNALLAAGEGTDTFGNTGDLRIPAQHTAPGTTFVNSAGQNLNKLHATQTGNNPFLYGQAQQQQYQYTGMPATQRLPPAQTGPASASPWGTSGQNQTQYAGGSGSLIDL